MAKYTLRKLLALIPKLLIISVILFLALELMPGDPLSRTMEHNVYVKLTEYQKEQARENLGLNDPAPIRYFRWLGGIITGDLGYTSSNKEPVAKVIWGRLPQTLELALWALLFSTLLGMALGFICAVKKNTFFDHFFQIFGIIGTSVPEFFVSICMVVVFALNLKWFPAGGRVAAEGQSRFFVLFLPIATMTLIRSAANVRNVRATMLDVMEKDYIKTARSKGLSEFVVNFKHVLRNALIPQVSNMVLGLTVLVSGSMIIEQVFNYLGMGQLALVAQNQGDTQLVLTMTMIVAVVVLLCSALCDILVALLDPRIRLGK